MKILNKDKSKLVDKVFNGVYQKYDLMNDVMSFGTHRLWKNNLVSWMKLSKNLTIIDVASGTGDIAKLCSKKTKNQSKIYCVEPNEKMLKIGKNKLSYLENLEWVKSPAEKLPFKDNYFDIYVISFGIRNVSDIHKTLQEAYRVLKKGGRFFCLEFSKVENEVLSKFYSSYSRIIPRIGELIVGDRMPYDYLIQSINDFYSQKDLLDIIEQNKFIKAEYRNLANGVAAIHTGWKI
tara:strand:+ start:45 stop:749 length:705 start_codon:yes stop_codon:yes gene_type:complete